MNLDRYNYNKERPCEEYHFYSEGPNGRIHKMVRIELFAHRGGAAWYNLVLGDWDEGADDLDIFSVTNNGDTEKVLATVAAIVIDFTRRHDTARILATGSTPARTRRYQMGIHKILTDIEELFYVYGRREGNWQPFRKNINYDTFLIFRREFLILEEVNEIYMTSSTKKDAAPIIPYSYHLLEAPEKFAHVPAVVKKRTEALRILEESPFPEVLNKKK